MKQKKEKENRQATEKELEDQAKLHQLLSIALEELEENHRGELPPDVLPVVIF